MDYRDKPTRHRSGVLLLRRVVDIYSGVDIRFVFVQLTGAVDKDIAYFPLQQERMGQAIAPAEGILGIRAVQTGSNLVHYPKLYPERLYSRIFSVSGNAALMNFARVTAAILILLFGLTCPFCLPQPPITKRG